MSAQQTHPGSLSRAHLRIVGLLDELNTTVESVEQLAQDGAPEEALRLVDEQRASLYATVESISREVAKSRRRRLSTLRKQAAALAAAAVLAVSGIAGAVGMIVRGGDGVSSTRDGVDRGTTHAPRSHEAPQASVKTATGATAVDGTPLVKPATPAEGDDSSLLGDVEPPPIDDHDHRGVVDRAKQTADDTMQGNPQPPATGKGPLDSIGSLAPNQSGAQPAS